MKRKLLLLLVVAMVLSLALTACVDREITKLTIVDGTFDYEYEKDSTPDFSNLKVKVTYSDGQEREVAVDKLTLGTLDTSSTGTKQFTITYDDFTLTVDVKVVYTEPPVVVTLDKIEIDKTSVLSKVKVGDAYSTAGLKVSATYSDNSKKDIALADLTVTAPDTATAGAKKLTVSYTEENKTVNAEMDVTVVGVKSLTLIGAPTSVKKGETLDTSGISANVIYTDDSSEALTNDKLAFAAFDTAEAALQTLTATYLDGQATASIPVIEAISINVSGVNDYTTNIPDGQDIDLAAVKAAATISVNYGYGETVVTTEAVADTSTLTVTDGEVEGVRYLTFTYAGLTKSIQVLEGAAVIESIALNFGTAKNYVAQDHAFATAGIYLVATYTNDTTANITEGFTLSDIVTTEAGEQTLTATYDGKTATATVYVLPVTAIAVDGTPALSVMKGETLDAAAIAALTFTVTYSDNSGHIVTESGISIADMAIGTIDTTVGGDKTFAVTYKGATGNVPFYVHTESSLEFKSGSTTVTLGEPIDLDSLVFEVTYTDGSKNTVTVADGLQLEANYLDKLTNPGTVSINVTYGDATGSFSVLVNEYYMTGVEKPEFMQQFEATEKKKYYLNQANINEYVVGDDNPFIFRLLITAEDANERPVDITNYTSVSKVYLVEGSTETLLEGAALATYVEIDEFANSFDFTDAAIGKTFKIATIPATLKSYTDYIKTFSFKVVDGWNIYSAKELNILTNYDDFTFQSNQDGAKNQLQVAKDFLAANNIAAPTAPIAGAIIHGDIKIEISDLPADYLVTIDGVKYLHDNFSVFPHSIDYRNPTTGKYEFTFYGNFFAIYSYNVPIITPSGTWGDAGGLGLEKSDGVSSSQLFNFESWNRWNDYLDGTYNGDDYQVRMENVHLMDDNPNDPTGNNVVPDRAVRGLIAVKMRYVHAEFYNSIIERYYISIFADKAYMNLELNYAKLYNAWQNHILCYADNELQDYYDDIPANAGTLITGDEDVKVIVKNSSITACGGPVILSQTEKTFDDGSPRPYNANIRCDVTIDDATEIWTYVTSESVWFKTFGAQQYIAQIEALEAGMSTGYGTGFRVTNPLTGYSGTFMNMIYVNMNAAFGVSGDHSDVDGQLNIGGTLVTNMDSDNVALETLKNAGAPLFQSTAAASGDATWTSTIIFANLFTDDFQSLMSGKAPAQLTNPNHPVFSGDYVTMYYMGMGITFGSYHAHSSTGDDFCKPAN